MCGTKIGVIKVRFHPREGIVINNPADLEVIATETFNYPKSLGSFLPVNKRLINENQPKFRKLETLHSKAPARVNERISVWALC